MNVDVFIPWANDRGRLLGLSFVEQWIHAAFPDEFRGRALTPIEPFTRASACNLAAERSTAEVVVFIDADSVVPTTQLDQAIRRAGEIRGFVRAYDVYTRLSEQATLDLQTWSDSFLAETNWSQPNTVSHGVIAMHRQSFVDLGGYDPRFEYFYDDCSFDIRAQDAPWDRVAGPLVHLWHPPRVAPDSDEVLWRRYEHEDPVLVRAEAGFPL